MADVRFLVPFIQRWEGGYVNDPDDLGGATNMGVTIAAYRHYRQSKGYVTTTVSDLKKMTNDEWLDILKINYWDKWKADDIDNQSIANILVDWVWASGSYGIKLPQKLLGVTIDGIVGPKTLGALNNYPNEKVLFDKIKQERIDFVERIVASRPANKKFRKGWLNRINEFTFQK